MSRKRSPDDRGGSPRSAADRPGTRRRPCDWAEAEFLLSGAGGTFALTRHTDSGAGYDDILIQVAEATLPEFARKPEALSLPARILHVRVERIGPGEDIAHDQITDVVGRAMARALASDAANPVTETSAMGVLEATCQVLPAGSATGERSGASRPGFDRREPHQLASVSLESVLATLRQRNEELDAAQEPVIAAIQENLRAMEGKSYGSFEANRRVVLAIQETADRVRRAFACPKCGKPAKLRCARPGRSTSGSIYFEHYTARVGGKKKVVNHGGASTFPALTLVPPENPTSNPAQHNPNSQSASGDPPDPQQKNKST